jgi:hypothetical protein
MSTLRTQIWSQVTGGETLICFSCSRTEISQQNYRYGRFTSTGSEELRPICLSCFQRLESQSLSEFQIKCGYYSLPLVYSYLDLRFEPSLFSLNPRKGKFEILSEFQTSQLRQLARYLQISLREPVLKSELLNLISAQLSQADLLVLLSELTACRFFCTTRCLFCNSQNSDFFLREMNFS